MVRAGGMAGRRADAAIGLLDQLRVVEVLLGRVAPELLAHALVHALGEGFRQPVGQRLGEDRVVVVVRALRSEEHTSELQSLMRISYAVFCFKKNNTPTPSSRNEHTLIGSDK